MSGDGCGLFCSSDVEKAKVQPQWYDIGYGLRLRRSGKGLEVEIVDGSKRLATGLDQVDVDELYRFLVEEYKLQLYGDEKPSMTALYTIKALLDAATSWLRIISRERAHLKRKLDEAYETLAKYQRLKELHDELEKKYDEVEDKEEKAKIWKAVLDINSKLVHMSFCVEENICMEPPRAVEYLEKSIKEIELIEKRVALAAISLSNAWRALTHPDISDLERLYDYTGRTTSEHTTLWQYFVQKEESKAEVAEQ